MLSETASAKINLTLKVLGRRNDGYHELESLVVFTGFGDRLHFTPGGDDELIITGPFASDLRTDSNNLVMRAREEFVSCFPNLGDACAGAFELEKRLPVASGIGGGSSDAGAALRLLARHTGIERPVQLANIALALGADVPACVTPYPCMMRGLGEQLVYFDQFPGFAVLLVNPGIALSTVEVFQTLGARASNEVVSYEPPEAPETFVQLIRNMKEVGNDLRAPAFELEPSLIAVEKVMCVLDGVRISGMSGSGATHFALFEDLEQANQGAETLKALQPDWWCVASEVTRPRAFKDARSVSPVHAERDDVE